MDPNDDKPSTNPASPPLSPSTATTPTPTPTKKLPPTPLPPRWRFVNDAKKAHGYSTADAGQRIPGLSAEELAAKYRAPTISEISGTKRREGEVGRLNLREEEQLEEEELLEGEFGGFRPRVEEEMTSLERVGRTWNSISRGETHSLTEEQQARSSNEPSQEEEKAYELNENFNDCEGFIKLEAGERKDSSIEIESMVSCHSVEEQHTISVENDNTQDHENNTKYDENNVTSLNEDSSQSPKDIIEQDVSLYKPVVCENTDNHRITPPRNRKFAFLLFLLLLCALALSLGLLFGTRAKNQSNQYNLVLVPNATRLPSDGPSNYPSFSNTPSLLPTFDCRKGTIPFHVEIIQEQNLTAWTQAEIFAYDATWTLSETCSGDVIMECLPCQSMTTSHVNSETRKNNLFDDHARIRADRCLPSKNQYIFEVKASGRIGTCCGFAASKYMVTYDNDLIVEGETTMLTKNNKTGALSSLNGETSGKLMEFRAYFGSQEVPCPTSSPSHWPTPVPTNLTLIESMQPSTWPSTKPNKEPTISPSIQPIMIPTMEPTCSSNNGDFNLCFALDMSGSVCNQGTGFECNSCEPVLICNADGVSIATCCLNFLEVVTFTKDIVTSLGSLLSNQSYSVVQFATNATLVTSLTSSNKALDALDEMIYSGGCKMFLCTALYLCYLKFICLAFPHSDQSCRGH
ncbi:hypothetical protein HJC23_007474 [Cyclotella cryptica]|uniref:VWFA domain-containing protein n=1 Tax=Cyclotella cryptica TaxID=29204 RepID=A0ABD3NU76_9STRA